MFACVLFPCALTDRTAAAADSQSADPEAALFVDSPGDLDNGHPHLFMHGYGVDNVWWDKVASDPGYQEIWGRIADRAGTGNRFTILNAAFAYTLSKQDKFGDLCKRVVTGLKVPRGKENSYKRCIGPAAYAAAFDAVADGKDSRGNPWLTTDQRSAALKLIADTLRDCAGPNGDDTYGEWEYKTTHNFFASAFSNQAAMAYVLRGEPGYEALARTAIEGVKKYHNWRTNGIGREVGEWRKWKGPLTGDGFPFEGPQYGGYIAVRGMFARHFLEMNEYPNPPTVVDENLTGFFLDYNFAWMSILPPASNNFVKVIKTGRGYHGYLAGFRFSTAVNHAAGREVEARVARWFTDQMKRLRMGDSMNVPSLEFMWYRPGIEPLSPEEAGWPGYRHLDDSEFHVYRDSWKLADAGPGEIYVYFRNNAHHGHNYWDEKHSNGTSSPRTSQTSSHEAADNGHFCIYKSGSGYVMDFAGNEGSTTQHNCLTIDGKGIRMSGRPSTSDRGFNHPEFANLDVVGAVDSDYGHALDAIIGPAYELFDPADLDAYRRYFFVIRDPMYVIVVDDIEAGHTARFHGYKASNEAHYEMLYPEGAQLAGDRPMTFTTKSPQLMFLCHPSPSGVSIEKRYVSGDVLVKVGADSIVFNPDGSTYAHGKQRGNALLFAERPGGALIFKTSETQGSQYGLVCKTGKASMSVSGDEATLHVYGTGDHTVSVRSPRGDMSFTVEAGTTVARSLAPEE